MDTPGSIILTTSCIDSFLKCLNIHLELESSNFVCHMVLYGVFLSLVNTPEI